MRNFDLNFAQNSFNSADRTAIVASIQREEMRNEENDLQSIYLRIDRMIKFLILEILEMSRIRHEVRTEFHDITIEYKRNSTKIK